MRRISDYIRLDVQIYRIYKALRRLILPRYQSKLRLFDVSDWRPIRFKINSVCFLKVFDFNYGSSGSQKFVGGSANCSSLMDDLDSLPPQESRFRVYIVENSSMNHSTLYAHLSSRGFPANPRLSDDVDDTFEALADQWKGLNATRYESKMYSFINTRHKFATGYGQIGNMLGLLAGLVKMNLSIQIRDVDGTAENSIIIIMCEVLTGPIREEHSKYDVRSATQTYAGSDSWSAITETLNRFCRYLLESSKLCEQLPQLLQSPEEYKQYFLLRYCGATLNHHSHFLRSIRREYVRQRESIMDPRYSILRPSIMKEITADAYIYKEFHDIASDLASPVHDLIILLESALADPKRTREFRTFIAEIQCRCTDIIKTTSRFSRNLDHNLKYLDVSRNMQESMRVWILSALASIFLPLSVATGLLSMQTRFIDLHILLYDFCGVVVVIGTVLIVSFRLLRGYVYLRERFQTWTPATVFQAKTQHLMGGNIAYFIMVSIWALILASFLIGMIKDVSLGGKVLGYGIASVAGLFALFGLFMALAVPVDRFFNTL